HRDDLQLPRSRTVGRGLGDQPRLRRRDGLRSLHRAHGRLGQPPGRRALRCHRSADQVRVMADVNYQEEPLEAGEPVTARPTTWRDSKALKRFRRNPLAIVGLLVVVVFVLTAVFAPVITDVGRNCLRDLGLSAATQNDYKNPTKAVFWRTMFTPPNSCFTIPRVGFSNVPATAEASETLLGTTSGGYDIFYGLIWGTRTAFKIGLMVVGISLLAGLIIGSISGYVGGILDN